MIRNVQNKKASKDFAESLRQHFEYIKESEPNLNAVNGTKKQ